MNESVGMLVGFVLTLFIFSYLLGDNPLYRLAVHVLVGVGAAYAAIVIWQQVVAPFYRQIQAQPTDPNSIRWLIPVLFAFFLIIRQLRAGAWIGNWTLALLIGIGAALALVGAVWGTLWPQITAVSGSPVQNIITAVLTISTLLMFQFTGRTNKQGEWLPPIWQRGITQVGRTVLMITFGALFAQTLSTSLVLLTERISFYLTLLNG